MEKERGTEKERGLTPAWRRYMNCTVAALFFAAFFILSCGAAAQSSAGPSIEFDGSQYNFGKVSQGTLVKHEFIVKNKGTAELKIDRLVSSCGCTASHAANQAIPAGAESKISVEFDSSGFSGEKIKTVQVYSNDPQKPVETLTLTGTIEPDVVVEPANLFFKEVVRGAAQEQGVQKVKVSIRPDVQASIEGFKSYSPYVLVKELSGSQREKLLSVSISPEAPVGELRERVVINLKGAKLANINIPIFAVVRGSLKLSSNSLSFGILDPKLKGDLSRSVRLENLGPNPVNIQKIVSSDEAVKASYKTIKGGRVFVIQVEVDPSKIKDSLRASVDIVTDGSEMLSLNVYGAAPPA